MLNITWLFSGRIFHFILAGEPACQRCIHGEDYSGATIRACWNFAVTRQTVAATGQKRYSAALETALKLAGKSSG